MKLTVLLSLLAVGAVLAVVLSRGDQRSVAPPKPVWEAGFESGSVKTGEWSWWGEDDPTYTGISVVKAASEQLPGGSTLPELEGRRVGRFSLTPDDIAHERWNSKLYRGFFRRRGKRMYAPKDVSGSYRVSYFLPTGFRLRKETAIIPFQFKEQFRDPDGTWHQDPVWWLELRSARWMRERPHVRWHGDVPERDDAPVIFINRQNAENNSRTLDARAVPVDRWVELRADLRQRDRIDYYVDGERLGTARASEYPVSPWHGKRSEDWIFGIGNYSGNPGTLYADAASYTKPR